ncbi:hypothetical protein, partial [Streptomyces sp. NPDC017993]|uniref:hypothetical protein n=1 Tax=Streptomyces sp. NPDC017993 TaxID=3365027 RepID=UPI0037944F48
MDPDFGFGIGKAPREHTCWAAYHPAGGTIPGTARLTPYSSNAPGSLAGSSDRGARSLTYKIHVRTGLSTALDVVSLGESAVADEGCGYADEGEEVLGFAFVA